MGNQTYRDFNHSIYFFLAEPWLCIVLSLDLMKGLVQPTCYVYAAVILSPSELELGSLMTNGMSSALLLVGAPMKWGRFPLCRHSITSNGEILPSQAGVWVSSIIGLYILFVLSPLNVLSFESLVLITYYEPMPLSNVL